MRRQLEEVLIGIKMLLEALDPIIVGALNGIGVVMLILVESVVKVVKQPNLLILSFILALVCFNV